MIEYVRKTADGRLEVGSAGIIQRYDETLAHFLNRLSYRRLTTLAGAVEAARRQFGIRTRTPIYLGDDAFFLPLVGLRSPDCLLINHFAVVCVIRSNGSGAVIRFHSGMALIVPSQAILMRQRKLAERMLERLNGWRGR
ncbi:MAG: hypothetical protein V1761_03215 [bacterium]